MAQETLPGTTDRRLAGLLTLLAENATIVVSGARIAKEIGVSRSTVWRWVTRLRELGVRVKGQQRTGYFLEQVPDILTPDMLRQRLKGSLFGKRIYHFFKTESRWSWAMRASRRALWCWRRSRLLDAAEWGARGIQNARRGSM